MLYVSREITGIYRSNSYGLSSNKMDATVFFYKCLREYRQLPTIPALICTSIYLLTVFIKKVCATRAL